MNCRADYRLTPNQWDMLLQCNAISHWLVANLESALNCYRAEVSFMWVAIPFVYIYVGGLYIIQDNIRLYSVFWELYAWFTFSYNFYPRPIWAGGFFQALHCLSVHLLWWRHQMETFYALLALCEGNSPVTGEFPSQRPVTRSFDVFFDLCLNKQLSKPSRRWWFQMPLHSLWCHCNASVHSAFTTILQHLIFNGSPSYLMQLLTLVEAWTLLIMESVLIFMYTVVQRNFMTNLTNWCLVPAFITCLQAVIFNTLRPRQNGRHFPDNTFKRIFLNENV